MLQRRLFAALIVLVAAAVPLVGQEKDKDAKPPAEKAKDAKTADKDKDKDAKPADKSKEAKPADTDKSKDAKPADKEKAKETPADGGKVSLKWKLEKGKSFYQKMTTKTDQNMKILNSEPKQTQNQTFYFSWTPVEQKGDEWTIKQKIEGVTMEIDIGGTKINYDSTKDTTANNPLGEFFKALVGSEFTVTLNTKDQKVTKIEGREEFVKKLGQANPNMQALLGQILSEQSLREMAEPTFASVPNKEVAKGDKWTKENTLDMGPIGKYTNNYTYTFEGPEGKLDKIKVDATLKYVPPDEKSSAAGLPFKIKSADLKSTGGSGSVMFDPEKGRVDRSNFKLDLNGDLNIEIGGQTTKVELKQTQETTVETSDTNPLQKKS
jgi:Family of unknown function (DUF6263)